MREVNLLETVVRIHSLKKYPVYYTENNEADQSLFPHQYTKLRIIINIVCKHFFVMHQ